MMSNMDDSIENLRFVDNSDLLGILLVSVCQGISHHNEFN